MDVLEKEITPVVNKFIKEKPSIVKDMWDDFVCCYSRFFDDETFSLLESLREDVPNLYNDIASYTCLSIKWARKYEKTISKDNWKGMLHHCETDEDFNWVASHLDYLPYWIKNSKVGRKFSHLLSNYKIQTP